MSGCSSYQDLVVVAVGKWESRRDFQGRAATGFSTAFFFGLASSIGNPSSVYVPTTLLAYLIVSRPSRCSYTFTRQPASELHKRVASICIQRFASLTVLSLPTTRSCWRQKTISRSLLSADRNA